MMATTCSFSTVIDRRVLGPVEVELSEVEPDPEIELEVVEVRRVD